DPRVAGPEGGGFPRRDHGVQIAGQQQIVERPIGDALDCHTFWKRKRGLLDPAWLVDACLDPANVLEPHAALMLQVRSGIDASGLRPLRNADTPARELLWLLDSRTSC